MIGIDEVGRGCWAGPLVVGAVRLPVGIVGLKDSKLLTARRREQLAELIILHAHVGLGWVTPAEVDDLGLTAATIAATMRALGQLIVEPDEAVIIDGTINYAPDVAGAQTLIKADQSVPEVAAASIIAKVQRDAFMRELDVDHPRYGFARHVGYGTALHQAALARYGPLADIHRFSFKPIQKYQLP